MAEVVCASEKVSTTRKLVEEDEMTNRGQLPSVGMSRLGVASTQNNRKAKSDV